MTASPPESPPASSPPPGMPGPSPGPSLGALRDLLRARFATARAALGTYARRNRAVLWPLVPVLLLCVLSAPLLGAWMRWVELPRIVREDALQPCTDAAAGTQATATAQPDATPAAGTTTAALDAQEAALTPASCAGMRRIDSAGLRTAAYRFEDGSLFTLHLRAPPGAVTQGEAAIGPAAHDAAADTTDTSADTSGDAGFTSSALPAADLAAPAAGASARADSGSVVASPLAGPLDTPLDTPFDTPLDPPVDSPVATPTDALSARPAPPPILTATCPVQSRQSLLVLAGLLLVGVVVILHRLRAGGKFLDFRNIVREPLRPGEMLLLIYAFTLILGTGVGLQFGGCAAAEHRDAVQVEHTPTPLQELAVPTER